MALNHGEVRKGILEEVAFKGGGAFIDRYQWRNGLGRISSMEEAIRLTHASHRCLYDWLSPYWCQLGFHLPKIAFLDHANILSYTPPYFLIYRLHSTNFLWNSLFVCQYVYDLFLPWYMSYMRTLPLSSCCLSIPTAHKVHSKHLLKIRGGQVKKGRK